MFALRRINKVLPLYSFIFDPDIDAFFSLKGIVISWVDAAILFCI